MEDIYVAQLMSTDLVTATPEALVEDAARLLMDNDVARYPSSTATTSWAS